MAVLVIEVRETLNGGLISTHTESLDEESRYYCGSCESGYEEEDTEPTYTCGSCGSEFTRANSADGESNRCPDCNKFGAKNDERACPNCEEPVEMTECAECPTCDEWIALVDLAVHYSGCAK